MRTRRRVGISVSIAVLAVALGALTSAVNAGDATARAALMDKNGSQIGTVKFIQQGDKVLVKAEASTLTAGFHGFHIHATGVCTAPGFTSSGGHYAGGTGMHKDHAGDMPVLLASSDGTASMRFTTDRFAVADIVGRAVVVHAERDNYANIPGRYHSHDASFNPSDGFGPDSDTLAKGDAGARSACGVIVTSS